MLAKAAKMVAYAKAPAKTFAVLHPLRALKMGVAYLIVTKTTDGRRVAR